MARDLYRNWYQYHLFGELEAAVRKAWSEIGQERLYALFKLMRDRYLKVIELREFVPH